MENIQYEGLLGILSEINKKVDAIQTNSKSKEIQPANQITNSIISKEEIEAILKGKTDFLGNYFEYKHKILTEHHSKIVSEIKAVAGKIDALPIQGKVSLDPILKLLPQPKKVAIFGFEFLRTSLVIFILSVALSWSLIMNIKQLDNYRMLKIKLNQQTEYILHLQQKEKAEKEKKK